MVEEDSGGDKAKKGIGKILTMALLASTCWFWVEVLFWFSLRLWDINNLFRRRKI